MLPTDGDDAREVDLERHGLATASAAAPVVGESLIVPPAESSAARAQRFVRRVLAESDVDKEVANLAVLMTKALIINGILHARSAIAVTIKVAPESIRIEVADGSPLLANGARSWGVASISR
jgi:hypothetical protein